MAERGSRKGRAGGGDWLVLMDDTSIGFEREAPGDREGLKVPVTKGLNGWDGFRAVGAKRAQSTGQASNRSKRSTFLEKQKRGKSNSMDRFVAGNGGSFSTMFVFPINLPSKRVEGGWRARRCPGPWSQSLGYENGSEHHKGKAFLPFRAQSSPVAFPLTLLSQIQLLSLLQHLVKNSIKAFLMIKYLYVYLPH